MYSINVVQYYFNLIWTWISDHVTYIYNNFMDYSPVIKIAALSLTFSLGLIIFTLLQIFFNSFKNRRWRKS